MAQLLIWSPGCREWLNCQLDEITWLDRQLLSGGKDATLHRPPRCAGFRHVDHGWELFSHDTTYQVYVSPAEETPLNYETIQAGARHVLPAALARYEHHAVSIESVVGRLRTPNWKTLFPSPTNGVSTMIVIPTKPRKIPAPTRRSPK